MFFPNLTAAEFFALFGALSGLITALYLLDRAKRKQVVSTLRFWTPAAVANVQQNRKRIREPWSLVLQLAGLLLLLLAIAQLQLGSRDRRGRDHVVLLDTSSWAEETISAEGSSRSTLLDEEKEVCRRYLTALPRRDRVMLVRADGLATPMTSFTSDHVQVLKGLTESVPGFSALNIEQALAFAKQAQGWSGGVPGEIVYIGPKLVAGDDIAPQLTPNLRIISLAANRENCGIRRLGVKRSEEDPNAWHATVTLKNYGSQPHVVRVRVQFAGTSFAPRVFAMAPNQEASAEYGFTTNTGGQLVASLEPDDVLSSDDRAALELPVNGALRIAVYTSRPDVLRPLLEANHRLAVKFFSPGQYVADPAADVMLLDQFAPPAQPKISSLWIEPPEGDSPLPVKAVVLNAVIKTWHAGTVLAAGLHAKEARLPRAEVFENFEGDIPVGSLAEGPVIVARTGDESRPKLVAIGFDPLQGQLRYEVTTPLLFANLLRWLAPEAFRALDLTAGQIGAATVTLDPSEHADHIRVIDEKGAGVPFTIRDQTLELFASRPAIVHIVSQDRERVLSLTLPELAQFEWNPAARASGLPRSFRFTPSAVDMWQALAILAALALFAEWILFAQRSSKLAIQKRGVLTRSRERDGAEDRVLVSK